MRATRPQSFAGPAAAASRAARGRRTGGLCQIDRTCLTATVPHLPRLLNCQSNTLKYVLLLSYRSCSLPWTLGRVQCQPGGAACAHGGVDVPAISIVT